MNALAFLHSLRSRGICIRTNGTQIVAGPDGLLMEADRETVKAIRADIIAILQSTGKPIPVLSHTVDEIVHVIEESFDTIPATETGPVIYTRAELERMDGLPPDAIRGIHDSKRRCGGLFDTPPDEGDAGSPCQAVLAV